MAYQNPDIARVAEQLRSNFEKLEDKHSITRDPALLGLYGQIKTLDSSLRADFGRQLNQLKSEVDQWLASYSPEATNTTPIDITAPFDLNVPLGSRPSLLPSEQGSTHPLMREQAVVVDILGRMGFLVAESREIDDDYHMFESLNFPEGHPARDDYDTFMTDEGLIAPAHTSTMQNRVMKAYKADLESGKGIRVVIPGRVFRNEDLDARHEHTFYQFEGVYVDEGINAGNLIATLKAFLEEYYGQSLEIKTQPYYFPFTEPSFEFVLSCPFCQKKGCNICSQTGWIELLGCGMIHPNVLKMAGIDPVKYTGFAWGGGIDRLVMMKYSVEDVRYFQSANLKFLRQFV